MGELDRRFTHIDENSQQKLWSSEEEKADSQQERSVVESRYDPNGDVLWELLWSGNFGMDDGPSGRLPPIDSLSLSLFHFIDICEMQSNLFRIFITTFPHLCVLSGAQSGCRLGVGSIYMKSTATGAF